MNADSTRPRPTVGRVLAAWLLPPIAAGLLAVAAWPASDSIGPAAAVALAFLLAEFIVLQSWQSLVLAAVPVMMFGWLWRRWRGTSESPEDAEARRSCRETRLLAFYPWMLAAVGFLIGVVVGWPAGGWTAPGAGLAYTALGYAAGRFIQPALFETSGDA